MIELNPQITMTERERLHFYYLKGKIERQKKQQARLAKYVIDFQEELRTLRAKGDQFHVQEALATYSRLVEAKKHVDAGITKAEEDLASLNQRLEDKEKKNLGRIVADEELKRKTARVSPLVEILEHVVHSGVGSDKDVEACLAAIKSVRTLPADLIDVFSHLAMSSGGLRLVEDAEKKLGEYVLRIRDRALRQWGSLT